MFPSIPSISLSYKVPPSPCPVPPPDDVMRPGSLCPSPGPSNLPRRGRRTPPPVNVTQLMNLAGALDIAAAISAADGPGLLSAPAHFRREFFDNKSKKALDAARAVWHQRFHCQLPEIMTTDQCNEALKIGFKLLQKW